MSESAVREPQSSEARMKVEILPKNEPNPHVQNCDNQKPLYTASFHNLPSDVSDLIRGGTDLNAKLSNGRTPLQFACERSCCHDVETLIKAGAFVDYGESGDQPLILCAARGLVECTQVLLNYGADKEVIGPKGTQLYRAVDRGHINVCRALLEAGANPFYVHPHLFRTICLVPHSFSGNLRPVRVRRGIDFLALHQSDTRRKFSDRIAGIFVLQSLVFWVNLSA